MSKIILYSIIATSFTISSLAATSPSSEKNVEMMCKAKAKEIAIQTYDTCVTENKQAQIDQIKKEYQDKLNELKKHYDTELKKMGLSQGEKQKTQTSSKSVDKLSQEKASDDMKLTLRNKKNEVTISSRKIEKPTKGIAKSLPSKQNKNEALEMNSENEDTAVVMRSISPEENMSVKLRPSTGNDLSEEEIRDSEL